jgi:hypothetical protein
MRIVFKNWHVKDGFVQPQTVKLYLNKFVHNSVRNERPLLARYAQPRMVEHVLCGKPQFRCQLEHVLNQLLGQIRHVLPVLVGEVVLAGQDAIEQLFLVVVLAHERGITAQEDVKDHSGRPHVDLSQTFVEI